MACKITFNNKTYTEEEFDNLLQKDVNQYNSDVQTIQRFIESKIPDSKVKDILWHGSLSKEKFESFDKNKEKTGLGENVYNSIASFTNRYNEAYNFAYGFKNKSGHIVAALLNIKNPEIDSYVDKVKSVKNSNKDSVIRYPLVNNVDNIVGGVRHYFPYRNEQITILNSDKTHKEFEEFISQVVDSGIDESLNEKIRIKLQQLYPQIKLEYTNKPIEESNDEDVFNQDLNRFDADSRKAIYQLSLPLLKAKAAVEAFSEKAKMTVLTTAETLISENPLKYLHVSNYGKTGNVFVNIEELAKDLFKEFGEQVIPERFKQEAKAFYDNIHEPTQFEKPFENYKYNLEKVLKYEELELKNINSILKTDNNSALFNLLTKGIPTYYNQKSRYHSFNLKDDNGQVFTYSYKDGKLDHINKLVTEIEYKDWLGKEVKEGRTIKRHHSIDENEKIDAMLTLTKLQKDTNRLKLGIQKTILRTLENSIQLQKDRLKDPKLKDDFIYNEIGFKYDSMGGFSERDIERHGIETLLENVLKINNIIDEDKYLSKEIGVKADKLLEITNNEEYTTLKNKQKKINYILGHKEEFNNEYDNFEANFEDGDLLAPIPEWFLNAVSVMQTGKYFNEHKGFAAGFVKGFIHLEAKRQYDELHENNIQPKFQELVETKDINSLLTKGISFVKAVNLSNNLAILNQKDKNRIIGQANIKAMSVLIDAINQKQDTLPHEYAHHYIAWYRNTPIVQEAIKKWGSEEALVQSIGEQVVKQKGEAFDWWNKFVKWILDKFNSLSKLQKEELTQILTDAFLTNQNLQELKYKEVDSNKKIEDIPQNPLDPCE